jgi:hypothetical protein
MNDRLFPSNSLGGWHLGGWHPNRFALPKGWLRSARPLLLRCANAAAIGATRTRF